MCEVKAAFTRTRENPLQKAVDDSNKDSLRLGLTLNAMKKRYSRDGMQQQVNMISRFQNKSDKPYTQIYGAGDSNIRESGR